MNKNETALEMCLRILKERTKYWYKTSEDEFETGIGAGYDSAAMLLEIAMQDNIDALRQFDYYHEDKEEE